MKELCHKQKPSKTDILAQALAPVTPSLPLSQLSRDTLLPLCAYGQLPKKSAVFLSTSFPGILSSSARKEGPASRDSELSQA